jgi:uncharacterized MAPEG superfamily protein
MMPLAYWCVLVAALLPLVWVSYAKFGVDGDNHRPREDYERLSPRKRRAYAAHQNAYENFPFFAAAVMVAITQGASITVVNWLAVTYVVIRLAHGLLYIGDYATARSAIYTLGLLVNIAIFVLPALG